MGKERFGIKLGLYECSLKWFKFHIETNPQIPWDKIHEDFVINGQGRQENLPGLTAVEVDFLHYLKEGEHHSQIGPELPEEIREVIERVAK
jgi:hypothetical protein